MGLLDVFTFQCPDLTGKTVLITGANSGIGFFAAKEFISHGANIVVAVRNPEQGRKTEEELNLVAGRARKSSRAVYIHLDLADFESVLEFEKNFRKLGWPLHILCCNAGEWIRREPSFTKEGFQTQVGVQHFSHSLLCLLLLDKLKQSAPSRIVFTSSASEAAGDIDWNNVACYNANSDFRAYATAKLYNQLFVRELQHRLEGTGVTVLTAQPGMSQTNLFSKGDHRKWAVWGQDWMQYTQGLKPWQGAVPIVYAATSEKALHGKGSEKTFGPYYTRIPFYVFPWISNIGLTAEQKPANPWAQDDDKARRLFDETVKIIKEKTPKAHLHVPPPAEAQAAQQ